MCIYNKKNWAEDDMFFKDQCQLGYELKRNWIHRWNKWSVVYFYKFLHKENIEIKVFLYGESYHVMKFKEHVKICIDIH